MTRSHLPTRTGHSVDITSKRYVIWNCTDGVFAHPEPMTLAVAQEFIRQFPERYRRQGYYLTADGLRIRPQNVRLEIVDEDLGFVCWDASGQPQVLRGD